MDEPEPVETNETTAETEETAVHVDHTDHTDRGLLYIAKGQTFVDEATLSARRAKTVMPDCPITIVTDRDVDAECFDQTIIDTDTFTKSDKPRLMQETPYDRTIFLDTDTYLAESIAELFDLLDEFDVAFRKNRSTSHIPDADSGNQTINAVVPEAFPEFNAGVIVYKSNEATMDLLVNWDWYCVSSHEFDQRSLRPALYLSRARFTPIPNRFNCMHRNSNQLAGRVHVFHGPLVSRQIGKNRIDLAEAMEKLGQSEESRLYYVYGSTLFVDPSPHLLLKPLYRGKQIVDLVREHGLKATIDLVADTIGGS
jgi:hypothetical protein